MIGVTNPTIADLRHALFSTADSIYDSITNASYSRLNLLRAIDSIIPDDNVGDNAASAMLFGGTSVSSGTIAGFLNRIGEVDAYKWTATADGVLELDFQSPRLNGSQWLVLNDSNASSLSADGELRIQVKAGSTYSFGITDSNQIGSFWLNWDFTASATPVGPVGTPVELGNVDIESIQVNPGALYAFDTTHDGTLSVQLGQNNGMNSIRLFKQNGQEVIADQPLRMGCSELTTKSQVALVISFKHTSVVGRQHST